jgi:hypothetical protein
MDNIMSIMCKLTGKHKWRTVAIDTSNGWRQINKETQEILKKCNHIICFLICDSCGARSVRADDPIKESATFAITASEPVALQRTVWSESGKVSGYDPDYITWVDPKYAPLAGFDPHIAAMKNDIEISKILDKHSMVKDAFDQLETTIKLHQGL